MWRDARGVGLAQLTLARHMSNHADGPALPNTFPHCGNATVRRRTFITGAAAAAAITSLPAAKAAAAAPAYIGRFGYGVASGDPTATSVIIWTRATPLRPDGTPALPGSGHGAPLTVTWEIATDPIMINVIQRGTVRTHAESDHTVKVDVHGLKPYSKYYYRFGCGAQHSRIGHTQTAPDVPGTTNALRFAQVSCSNYTAGYFTAYRAIAERRDLDFVLHLGDYIYEYGMGEDFYGSPELKGTRDHVPATEIVSLADYRMRYAQYRSDKDLADAHAKHPWIVIFDDHEVTNDTHADGAENHQPNEGDFFERRAAAYQAYLEWLPIRVPADNAGGTGITFHRKFTFGDLADLSIIDTRQHRSKQAASFVAPDDADAAPVMADPTRQLMEPAQTMWLKKTIASKRSWHLIGNQTMMTRAYFPGDLFGQPGTVRINADAWDGYQPAQADLLQHMAAQPKTHGDTVVLTGDIHSSWAEDLAVAAPGAREYSSAGTEFVATSVTSDGVYEIVRRTQPQLSVPQVVGLAQQLSGGVKAINPWVKYNDFVRHGFLVVDVKAARVQVDYFHTMTPTPEEPNPRVNPQVVPEYDTSWQTRTGERVISEANGPLKNRSDSARCDWFRKR